jgi:nucleotide-binding universal stress UspA family protein
MYANILLSTDGSDVAEKGVKHGIALAKALNAKVTVITVTEAPMLYLPRKADLVSWEAARELWRSRPGYPQNSCMFPMSTQPLRLSKQQSPEAAT